MIDIVILMPAFLWVYVLLGLPTDISDFQDLMNSGGTLPGGTVWLGSIACSFIVATYGALFEAFRGATPGKRLLGLHVMCSDGTRCRRRPAIVRNFLRLVDFQFPPVLLLVAMTINRQRLGDIVARTVVVCQGTQSPPTSDADGPSAKESDT